LFLFHDAEVIQRFSTDSGEKRLTFDDTKITDAESSLRLRGAVIHGSSDRRGMLGSALRRCRAERRKVVIFLGGDTEGEHAPTFDATELLPAELEVLGYGPDDYEVVVGDDPQSQRKIDAFGASNKWILISVNLVSEGVDIPELSAAIFLTSVTAKQTTVQRIGRALRMMGDDDPHKDALIFMFRHPDYVDLSKEIINEADEWQEIMLRRKGRDPRAGGDGGEPRRNRAEAIGVGDGRLRMVRFHDREWPADLFERKQRELAERPHLKGLPPTILQTALYLLMLEDDDDGR
jgi:hypothetical protein